jgi:hypothetical protein
MNNLEREPFAFERQHMFPLSIPEKNAEKAYFFTQAYDVLTGLPDCVFTTHYGYLEVNLVSLVLEEVLSL